MPPTSEDMIDAVAASGHPEPDMAVAAAVISDVVGLPKDNEPASKYFPGKSHEQIAALTDDEINTAVNLACAHEGIPLFLETAEPPLDSQTMPDAELFKVGPWLFKNRADAEAVLKAATSARRYKQGYNWQHSHADKTYEPDDSELCISTEHLLSPAKYAEHQAALALQAQRQKEYDEQKKKYDDANGRRSHLALKVWEDVREARRRVSARRRVVMLCEQYVALANGDRAVAWNFLKHAEKLTQEDIEVMKLHEFVQETRTS